MGRARFPVRASGPAERLASFLAHLRLNGLAAGPGETRDALDALATVDAADPHEARLALKTLLARDAESWAGFDALFDAYWFSAGRERRRETAAPRRSSSRPALWSRTVEDGPESDEAGTERGGPDDGAGEAAEGEGRRLATRTDALTRRDLRRLVDPDEIARAEAAALRLARAIRDRC
ncbi:MAG: carbon monoxide dehydrogenase, partial [Paracoccaceae bacterium]